MRMRHACSHAWMTEPHDPQDAPTLSVNPVTMPSRPKIGHGCLITSAPPTDGSWDDLCGWERIVLAWPEAAAAQLSTATEGLERFLFRPVILHD